jgi:GH15 family glucan-1,4-alpha-glucosidase
MGVGRDVSTIMNTLTQHLEALAQASIRIIRENQSPTGGYVASPNFAVYNYSWFRDGAFIAHAMSQVGEVESARAFHNWAARNINLRQNKISALIERNRAGLTIDPQEHLHCRYNIDGSESKEEWTNFQLDGFGTWLWVVDQFRFSGQSLSPETIQAAQNLIPYLSEFWSTPSFDWWEESFGKQHVSTLGCISAGLFAVSKWEEIPEQLRTLASKCATEIHTYVMDKGVVNGHLTKWIGSNSVDGSLSALIAPLNWVGNSSIEKETMQIISTQLGVLGTHRHLQDVYFGGGPWPILSAFLALAHSSSGDKTEAAKILNWFATCANNALELPEQLPTNLLHPETRDEWIEKWGKPAEPLLWSHAMYLLLKKEVEGSINA